MLNQANEKNQTLALILFSIGIFMAQLDNGIISAALTTINDSFGVSANWGAWGVTLYTLGLAISVPIVGKLSDRYGRRKLFIVEVFLFALGSLLIALSTSFEFYLASRLIQSLGGGGIFIIATSHVLSTMPVQKHGKALGMLGGMNGIAAVLGPNIGSFILDITGNWKYLFYINLPIAAIVLFLAITKLEESKDDQVGRLDLNGTILLSLAILGIMLGLTNIEAIDNILLPKVYGFIIGGLLLFVALIVYEKRLFKKGGDPILPVALIGKPAFLMTLLIGMCSGALLAGMIFIPAFSEHVLGIAQENSGYWMTPLALATGVGAAMGGFLSDKRGPVIAVIISGVLSVIGFALFPAWIELKYQFIIGSMIAGVGMGIILGAPLNMLVTDSIRENKGPALAALSLSRQIGMTIAPAIYAGFISRAFTQLPTNIQGGFNEEFNRVTDGSEPLKAELAVWLQTINFSEITNMTNIMSSINTIENVELKQAILLTIEHITSETTQKGYAGLYLSATIIAALIIVLAYILKRVKAKQHDGTTATSKS